jgi:hypothetical protein
MLLLLALTAAVGVAVAGLAIAFAQLTGENVSGVLFSGQDQLPGLVSGATGWGEMDTRRVDRLQGLGVERLARRLPRRPALFLGAAAGILASHLPGYALTPAVAVAMGAAMVAVLRLPPSPSRSRSPR